MLCTASILERLSAPLCAWQTLRLIVNLATRAIPAARTLLSVALVVMLLRTRATPGQMP